MPNLPIAWSIAGSDSGGGAGIQADIQTFRDFGVHGATVVTCVTAQNTVELTDNHVVPVANVVAQLRALANDLPAQAIKIGALGSAENATAVLDFLDSLHATSGPATGRPFVVWDPVRQASVGGTLGAMPDETTNALLRRVDAVTPNAEELAAWNIDARNPARAAATLRARGAQRVYVTGGHGNAPGKDFWQTAEKAIWIQGDAFPGQGAHGGGCSLSSALAAARLSEDEDSAPVLAHMYVHQGLRALSNNGDAPGNGRPPLPHLGWPGDIGDLPRVVDAGRTPVGVGFPSLEQAIGLYAVVASADWVERCVNLGIDTVQLRMKDGTETALRQAVARSVAATRNTTTRLFVNDHWREAIDAGAYGIHLGQEDLTDADLAAIAKAGLRLGVSTHSYFEIARAHGVSPSYIAIGPIFPTTTKPMKFDPQGITRLGRWVDLLKPLYPLTAIGGIDVHSAPGVAATGVGSIAVVRAITEAVDPGSAVAELRAAMRPPSP